MNSESSNRTLLVLTSYHHRNTETVAEVIADVLDAQIAAPQDVNSADLQDYAVLGFGSGIYGAKHHEAVLELANRLPLATGKRAFIFSTSAIINKGKATADHSVLREILESKGYTIVDEFSCRGFNTNSFMKYFGGMNRGRPNAKDLERARAFARKLRQQIDR